VASLGDLSERALFSIDGTVFSWGDALAAAELRGSTGALKRQTQRSFACMRQLAAARNTPSDQEVHAAARQFRYDRGLLAADELEAWLDRWGMTPDDWTEYLRRALSLERCASSPSSPEADDDDSTTPEVLDAAVYIAAVCSGFLPTEANQLASDVALCFAHDADISTDAAAGSDRRSLIKRVIGSAAAVRSVLASDRDVDREIANKGLDWTRIEGESIELDDHDAAREAALSIALDGRSVAEVAADCQVEAQLLNTLIEDAPAELRTHLLPAEAGETVGPVAMGASFVVVKVHERQRPTTGDPDLRERARTEIVARRTAAELRSRVRWHDEL
jgi:hypothetical protein